MSKLELEVVLTIAPSGRNVSADQRLFAVKNWVVYTLINIFRILNTGL